MIVCNDEDQLNIHSFFALSQFFVTFVSLSFDWNITVRLLIWKLAGTFLLRR